MSFDWVHNHAGAINFSCIDGFSLGVHVLCIVVQGYEVLMAGLQSVQAFSIAFSLFDLGSYVYPLACLKACTDNNYCDVVVKRQNNIKTVAEN